MSKIKIFNYLLSLILLLSVIDCRAQNQLKEWEKTKKNFGYSYTILSNKNDKELLKVNIISPKKIEDNAKKQYLMLIANGFSKKLGNPGKDWKIYQNVDKEIYAENFFNNNNSKTTNIRLQTITTKQGVIMVVMLYKPEQVYKKYKNKINEIINDAKESFIGKNINHIKSVKTKVNTDSRPNFETIRIQGLKSIVAGFYTVNYDPMTDMYGVPKEDLILVFEDGTVSKDVKTILQKGISFSKKNNNKKWGIPRFKNGKYEVKWNNKKKYKVYESITKYVPISKDKRISGCWSTTYSYAQQTSTTGGHNTTLISYDYCFDSMGRFSKGEAIGTVNKQTSGGSGKEFSAGGSSSDNKKGWYYIDGYSIQLIYDNGKKEIFFINLKDKKKKNIKNYYLRLNNKMYFKKK